MFEHILRPLWAIINQTISKDSKFRKMAGIAFVCLCASVFCAFATAWISFPVYESMFRNPMYDSLAFALLFAGIIAVSMFYFMSTIGYYLTEKFRGIESILPVSLVATVMILGFCLGAFDAIQGARQGAKIRAEQVFKTQAFSESDKAKVKPYSDDIASIDAQVKALQADKIGGEMRWGNQKQIDRLNESRAKYVALQLAEITELKDGHTAGQVQILKRRESGQKNLSWFQACLYLLQIILTIPLANFDIELDGRDGERDGKYNGQERPGLFGGLFGSKKGKEEPATAGYPMPEASNVGYRFGQQKPSHQAQEIAGNLGSIMQELEGLKTELSRIRQNGNTSGNSTQNRVNNVHTNLNPETPYNLGKKYNLSKSQKEKVNRVRKAYLGYVKKHNTRPTITALSERTGMTRKTVKKYIEMMQKDNQELIKI